MRENHALCGTAGRRRRRVFTLERIVELFPAVGKKLNVRCELLMGDSSSRSPSAGRFCCNRHHRDGRTSTGLAPKVVKDILRSLVGCVRTG